MDDLISRAKAIDTVNAMRKVCDTNSIDDYQSLLVEALGVLPSAEPNIQTHLCDTCKYSYPECPSKPNTVLFGNGKGHDNICACNDYSPSAQPERKTGKWVKMWHSVFRQEVWSCSICYMFALFKSPYCAECGAKMEVQDG